MRLALVLVAVALMGCAGLPVELPAPDLATIDVSRPRPIQSERCGFQLLLLIPISINNRLDRAYSDLRMQAADGVIGDVSLRERWIWAFVGTLYCSELTANAYPKLQP